MRGAPYGYASPLSHSTCPLALASAALKARLIPCRKLSRSERIRKPRRGRARFQGLLLALMRCPSAKIENSNVARTLPSGSLKRSA